MATLSVNYSGVELDRRQLGNGVENNEGSPTSSQNIIDFGPLTAKIEP